MATFIPDPLEPECPAPVCETCDGTGTVPKTCRVRVGECCGGCDVPCPDCRGTNQESEAA